MAEAGQTTAYLVRAWDDTNFEYIPQRVYLGQRDAARFVAETNARSEQRRGPWNAWCMARNKRLGVFEWTKEQEAMVLAEIGPQPEAPDYEMDVEEIPLFGLKP